MLKPVVRALAAVTVVAAVAIVVRFSSWQPNIVNGAPAAEAKPVIGGSLADDGRIGKISDSQGLVVLKPALAQRWTAVAPETLLLPQDWLRATCVGPTRPGSD